MGKIRVKTFGDEAEELEEKKKLEKKREEKKARQKAQTKEIVEEAPQEDIKPEEEVKVEEPKKEKVKIKVKKDQKAPRSQKYGDLNNQVDKTKTYTLSEALDLLVKLQRGKFDETVEIHVNTLTPGISGNVTLPHGTGKKTRVAIATDAVISEIEKGTINFDILVAEPSQMSKLAKVARILGPKGLMPSPKNGTIAPKPEEVAKKYEGGLISFKTEAKNPLLHLTVGKISFGKEKLTENIEEMLKAVKKANIVNVTLKSTMSPGIKLKV
ncbi:MAG: hypothetical protein HY344_03760 [Candidatus Levybacteria bacterium]|nr:hypothetical protein [Candidatus Levybacteria bacterium]